MTWLRKCGRCWGTHRIGEVCPKAEAAQLKWQQSRRQQQAGPRKSLGSARASLLKANPHCAGCDCRLNSRTAQVDHIKGRAAGGSDDLENLQLMCRECHLRKSKQQAAAGRRRQVAEDTARRLRS